MIFDAILIVTALCIIAGYCIAVARGEQPW